MTDSASPFNRDYFDLPRFIRSKEFGRILTENLQDLRAAVAFFTPRVAEKLSEHRLPAGELTVFVTTDRFKEALDFTSQRIRLFKASNISPTRAIFRPSYTSLSPCARSSRSSPTCDRLRPI